MPSVTGLTAERMLEIEAQSIVDGEVVGDNLILTRFDETTIDAGNVRGPSGGGIPGGGTEGQIVAKASAAELDVEWVDPASVMPDASTTVKGIVELATDIETIVGVDPNRATSVAGVRAAMDHQAEVFIVAVSDETTALTTGTAKLTFRIPFAFSCSSVRASLTTASTSGNPAIDVNDGGVSIFSTTLTIDATEKVSTTAAVPAVLVGGAHAFADFAEVTVDIDTAGTGAKGLKLYFYGARNP